MKQSYAPIYRVHHKRRREADESRQHVAPGLLKHLDVLVQVLAKVKNTLLHLPGGLGVEMTATRGGNGRKASWEGLVFE